MKTRTINTTKPDWTINNLAIEANRYLPGQIMSVDFVFRNNSPLDLYLMRIGIQPEWLPNQWHAQESKELIKSGAQKHFSISVQIPSTIPLGEHELRFGIEGQYLSGQNSQPPSTQWSDPVILHVKRPYKGITLFLSHSTNDIALVRQLENAFDKEGIRVIIAEDITEPGSQLEEKFKRLIRKSNMLIALITEDGVRSEWVKMEVDYAMQINKPAILLRERTLNFRSRYEWVTFSKADPVDVTAETIKSAIESVQRRGNNDAIALIGVGLISLALLVLLSSGGRGSSN